MIKPFYDYGEKELFNDLAERQRGGGDDRTVEESLIIVSVG